MPITLVYPTNYELTEILQDLIPQAGLEDDPIFQQFPISNTDKARVLWEQQDNFIGLTQLRGVNGQPGRVANRGFKTYEAEPGYYGDVAVITEKDMLQWRKPGTPSDVWDISELVMRRVRQLLQMGFWRIRQVVWTLATSGTFSVASPDGVLTHTDTFAVQTANAAVSWGTYSTAAPYADFGSVQLLHAGHSVKFDSTAKGMMNQKTFNKMLKNTNSGDLYGFKGAIGATVIAQGVKGINEVLMNNDRPGIVVFDDTYLDPTGTAQRFIPDDVVAFFGTRPGNQPAGKTVLTPNATALAINEGQDEGGLMESPYKGMAVKVVDHGEQMEVGREIGIGLSFNFAPTVEFLSSVVVLNVA